MFSSGFFVIHDAVRGGQYNEAKLTRWQQVLGPGLDRVDCYVKSGADNSTFVQSSVQIDNYFASSMIVDDFEFANVAVLHHDGQEFDGHLRAGSQQDLSFVSFLSIA
jgi:hypothetical protein